MIIAVTVLVMVLSGLLTWLLARQSHGRLIAPRMQPQIPSDEAHRHARLRSLARSRLDPMSATGLALTAALALVVVGTVAVGIVLFMVRENVGFAHFDLSAARFGARHAGAGSTQFLRALTQLGGAAVLVPLTVLVLAIASRRQRSVPVASFLVLSVGGQFAIANTVKFAVNRARPTLDQLTGFSSSSFPSGHAVAAAASLAAFALVLGRGRSARTNSLLASAAVGLAGGIACTRVFLGVHWLTDVLAGLALGWAWFAVCSVAFGGRFLHFGAPAEQLEQAAAASSTDVSPVQVSSVSSRYV